MIKKVSGGYKVVSEKGKNLGGPYKTKKAAEKRFKQVSNTTKASPIVFNFDGPSVFLCLRLGPLGYFPTNSAVIACRRPLGSARLSETKADPC